MTCEFIKELVERESKIDDIGIKSRKEFIRDCRYTYIELCFKYIDKVTLSEIGKHINRDHSTVYVGKQKFKMFYGTNSFKANNIYDICNLLLNSDRVKIIEKLSLKNINSINKIIESYTELKNSYIKILEENLNKND